MLSLILYDTLVTQAISENVCIIQFADDIAMCVSGINRAQDHTILTQATHNIAVKEKLGLELELRKTQLVEFNCYEKGRCVHINFGTKGQVIKNKSKAKFLGILFDNQIKMEKHCNIWSKIR